MSIKYTHAIPSCEVFHERRLLILCTEMNSKRISITIQLAVQFTFASGALRIDIFLFYLHRGPPPAMCSLTIIHVVMHCAIKGARFSVIFLYSPTNRQ